MAPWRPQPSASPASDVGGRSRTQRDDVLRERPGSAFLGTGRGERGLFVGLLLVTPRPRPVRARNRGIPHGDGPDHGLDREARCDRGDGGVRRAATRRAACAARQQCLVFGDRRRCSSGRRLRAALVRPRPPTCERGSNGARGARVQHRRRLPRGRRLPLHARLQPLPSARAGHRRHLLGLSPAGRCALGRHSG
jgi:hypothetical protein